MNWLDVGLMGTFWIVVLAASFAIWKRRQDRASWQDSAAQSGQVEELYQDNGKTYARRFEYDEKLVEHDGHGPPLSGG